MDQYGVYQLVKIEGDTLTEALVLAENQGLISVDIEHQGGGRVTEIGGLGNSADGCAYWTAYIFDNGEWTQSRTSTDSTDLIHYGLGLFYVEYDAGTSEPVKGGPALLADKIPDIGNKAWDGSDEGVLFELVSGTGFTVHMNGTYSEDTVWDAFTNAVETYRIPFERQGHGI